MFGAVLPTVLPGARYEVFDLAPADLELFVRTAPDAGIAGFNVTIPHKVAVLPFLDLLDKTAAAVGAVNCVEVRPDGRFIGHNTDAPAFEACIRSLAPPLGSSASPIRSALILGGGGAARAVVHALRELGVPLIVLAERRSGDHRPRRAPSGVEGNIARPERSRGEHPEGLLSSLPRLSFAPEALAAEAPDFPLIVNCTPVGMAPNVEASPLEAGFRPGQIVFDLVYRPRPSRLLRLAEAAGATPVDGLCMLARQAAESLKLWTGIDVPFERFLAAVEG